MANRRVIAAIAAGVALLGGLVASATSAAAQSSPGQARPRAGGVLVTDIQIRVPGQDPVTAYLVRPERPARPGSLAGALYLHWFGPPNSTQNRTEFLAEAIELAGKGAVAILPQLTFPWAGDPVGNASDRAKVTDQLAAVAAGYQALISQPGVNPHRTAVIGHDYGGMFGALLAQRDHRVRAMVMMAGDATWANWFDTYWLDLPADQKPSYRAVFAGLDPVDNVSRLDSHVYLQWAERDIFIGPETRAAFSAANPAAAVSLFERADHFLNQPAKDQRVTWVSAQLGLD